MKKTRCILALSSITLFALLLSSCTTNFTGIVYEIGRTHETNKIPSHQENAVWQLAGKYYIKGTSSMYKKQYQPLYLMDFSSSAPYTLEKASDSQEKECYFEVEINNPGGEKQLLSVKNTIPAETFDLQSARRVKGLTWVSTQLQGDTYVLPSHRTERSFTGYSSQILQTVALPLDITSTICGLPFYLILNSLDDTDSDESSAHDFMNSTARDDAAKERKKEEEKRQEKLQNIKQPNPLPQPKFS